VRFLLDTRALLWWSAGDSKLSRRARTGIASPANTVLVSAATSWEIAVKNRLGKLDDAGPLLDGLLEYLADQEFSELPIAIRHTQRAAALPDVHRDPFDRLLVAQAQVENLVLVSNETLFDRYGIRRLW